MAGDDWMTPEHKAAALEGFRGNPVAMAYARAQSRPTLISWLEDCIAQDMTVAQEQRRFEQYVRHAVVTLCGRFHLQRSTMTAPTTGVPRVRSPDLGFRRFRGR